MEEKRSNQEMAGQMQQETGNIGDTTDQELRESGNTEDTADYELQKSGSMKDTVDQVLLNRIEMISSKNSLSDMPDKFTKRDYIQAAAIMVVCLCAVVAGAFLTI